MSSRHMGDTAEIAAARPHPAVVRLGAEDSVLSVVRGVARPGAHQRLYADVLPGATTAVMPLAPGVELHVTGTAPAVSPGAVVVWGAAWSADGPATDAEIRGVLEDPGRARRLTGRFVVAGARPGRARLVTSAGVVHTVKHVHHGGVDAWSTKGLAALALTGRPFELDLEAVAEFVVLDFVLGRRELAVGVEVLEEATVTDISAGSSASASYWPRAERLEPGPPTTPADLRRALTAAVMPVSRADGAYLALTAGRDSLLVASCLADAGVGMPTFTMGDPSWPDAVGARAVAGHLGWAHVDVLPVGTRRPSFGAAGRWSAWTEGQVLARDLVGAPLELPPDLRCTLSGSGGEIGRSFWWTGGGRQVVTGRRLLPRLAGDDVVERVHAELDTFPGEPARKLDAFYAFGRMRKWLARGRPLAGVTGTTAAYLAPAVVRALLDLPEEQRADSSGFDRAMAAGRDDLRAIAAAALDEHHRRGPWRRAVGHFRPPARREVHDLREMLAAAGTALDPVVDAVGPAWWEHAMSSAADSTRSRLSLWNAVSVAALLTAPTAMEHVPKQAVASEATETRPRGMRP